MRTFSFPFPKILKSWTTYGKTKCQNFQQKHPLFLCALYWLAGTIARTYPDCGALILLFLCPFFSYNLKERTLQGLCWLIPLLITPPVQSFHEGFVSGTFRIHHACQENVYYGEALNLYTLCGKTLYNLPCKILSKSYLEPKRTYLLKGTLHHTPQIIFKSNASNHELSKPKPLTIKERLRKLCFLRLQNRFSKENSKAFVLSLILGFPLPKDLSLLFRSKGLSHLFAISGWHFSLFASVLELFLSIFTLKTKKFISFVVLTLLMSVLPFSPSVWRAWISISLFCLSPYFLGSCSGLNRLGLGFLICSQFFPIISPAFALSFLATLGIQLFFFPIYSFLYTPWTILFSPFWLRPIRYLLSVISVSLSVQIFLFLPLIQFFGSFVLDGLIYNLFFPLLLLPLIVLILSSIIIPLLVPFTETIISWLLAHPWLHRTEILSPLSFSSPLSPRFLTLISLTLFILGVFLTKTTSTKSKDSFSAFIHNF
ncbi:ComEC/Rec2 family competence protein [Chlamydia sp. 17-3921]|uniref:ComEC/Rec2 family competence protein n=1 Tax=Chlamydia sp. 17-3921 TaxID=2675798 RepID=UPI001918F0D6|nr:ComEC/Rec2 family competence protein [Chlamydia sp. 17-3921]